MVSDRLLNLRKSMGKSKSAMAALVGVSDKTWSSWESGDTEPTASMYADIFRVCGRSMTRDMMEHERPELFSGLTADSPTREMRSALAEYIISMASERMVRAMYYTAFSSTGSDFDCQLQEWCMLDHMPMHIRLGVAQQIDTLYEVCEAAGMLINTGECMPDVEAFRKGLELGRQAAKKGKNRYK